MNIMVSHIQSKKNYSIHEQYLKVSSHQELFLPFLKVYAFRKGNFTFKLSECVIIEHLIEMRF